ncbi:MAG: phosphorylase [Alphaproteobacteria bacterium]|nr:phosphorylase [Alphaproteobacteria bacterium]
MLGIICGFKAEADIAQNVKGALVANAASRPELAKFLAENLIKRGATRLLSFGTAGGISPDLPVGSIVIGAAVVSDKGRWECDREWGAEIPNSYSGAIWGSDVVIANAFDKAMIFGNSGCLAADMESHCIAEVAVANKIPFSVVRIVTDTFSMSLPPVAMVPFNEDGTVNGMGVAISLLKHPLQMPNVIRLGLNTGKAMKKLRAIAAALNNQ